MVLLCAVRCEVEKLVASISSDAFFFGSHVHTKDADSRAVDRTQDLKYPHGSMRNASSVALEYKVSPKTIRDIWNRCAQN
jgi:hypothetical protein